MAVQVSDTQVGASAAIVWTTRHMLTARCAALYDLAADGMSRGTCTLIVSCRNQRRNSIMRNALSCADLDSMQSIGEFEDLNMNAGSKRTKAW